MLALPNKTTAEVQQPKGSKVSAKQPPDQSLARRRSETAGRSDWQEMALHSRAATRLRDLQHLASISSQSQQLQRLRIMAKQADQPQPAILQRAIKQPVITPKDGKAMQVDLDLADGDTTAAGGKPSVSPAGWEGIKKLGLTKGNSNWKKWVRFHLLNEDQGGPDDVNNLPVTTQKANHDPDWLTLEYELDKAAKDATQRPLKFYAFVKYHDQNIVNWTIKRGKTNKYTQTNSADYPNFIFGKLTVKGTDIASAMLSDSDGAIAPEQLKKVPHATARNQSGAILTGTRG
jgi:hypothetical protein